MEQLRAALRAVHGDSGWWHKVGVGGALMLSLVGYPWADGFLMQSVENSKRGFPTPLPFWHDWGTRYVLGLLGMLVDVTFFVVPLLLSGLLLFCAGATVVLAADGSALATTLLGFIGLCIGLYLSGVFLLGLSPIARLIFADEGRFEDALGPLPLRESTSAAARATYGRARLWSLPCYLPALLLGVATFLVARGAGVAALLATLLLAWLTSAALFYGRLLTMQLYVNAERSLRRRGVLRVVSHQERRRRD